MWRRDQPGTDLAASQPVVSLGGGQRRPDAKAALRRVPEPGGTGLAAPASGGTVERRRAPSILIGLHRSRSGILESRRFVVGRRRSTPLRSTTVPARSTTIDDAELRVTFGA